MTRIAIVGAECSGKTALAEQLMVHYHADYSVEVAREYLNKLGRHYVEADLLEIAELQYQTHGFSTEKGHEVELELRTPSVLQEHARKRKLRGYLFCDTDLITIYIWSMEKFGRAHPEIERLARTVNFDYWLLCKPDIPWVADPLRENPHDRDRLFDIYERTLMEFGKPYFIVEGSREERMQKATAKLDLLFGNREVEG